MTHNSSDFLLSYLFSYQLYGLDSCRRAFHGVHDCTEKQL